MRITIHEGDIHLLDLKTRMPFKYGIATMTEAPHAFVRLVVEVGGQRSTGIAADLLPPKWFTKDPARGLHDEIEEMLSVIEQAVRLAVGIRAASPFEAWWCVQEQQRRWGDDKKLPPLLSQFGSSLVERALIDAVCRSLGRTFGQVMRGNELGVRLAEIHPELVHYGMAGTWDRAINPMVARHTVGLADPLTDADIASEERLDDGLPQSLVACVRAYDLCHFKIKVTGELERDGERLRRIMALLNEYAPFTPQRAFTLDGNEFFRSVAAFREFWEQLSVDPALEDLFRGLLFVEQPFHRSIALEPEAVGGLKEWSQRPRMIIDESDAELGSLPRALELGYHGTSHKNCKGVFKSIANACLLRQRGDGILSGEDLANVGPVALLQDLAVASVLGVTSVERNGHHYFAGLSPFPGRWQKAILQAHPDLYHASKAGWPTLTIRGGRISLDSVLAAPFGVQPLLDVDLLLTPAGWRKLHAKPRADKGE